MRLSHSDSCIDVHDLPVGLAGKCSSDVVLPSGQLVGLHGCREDAHQLLQECITEISALPIALSPEAVLRLATTAYQQKVMAAYRGDAAAA